MTIYRMDDHTVVNTERAKTFWDESTRFDGNNFISLATGSQWAHETLYLSAKDRYYIEHRSQWQGTSPGAFYVSHEEAARWLLANDHEVPEDLQAAALEVSE